MRTTNYNMINYNVSIPEAEVPIFESLFKKYNVIVEPVNAVAEPIEEGDMLVAKYKKGLVKGYTNAKEMLNDILSEDDE